jgi:uncharacterized membrane protein
MTESQADRPAPIPVAVSVMHRVESATALDTLGTVLGRLAGPLSVEPLRSLLLGRGVGHALHPAFTDVPIGLWSSATLLDVLGGRRSRPAAELLLGAGLVAAVPTVVTGIAEWAQTKEPESRVGSLHAALNACAVVLYAASWRQRRRGHHGSGVVAGLVAMGVASGAGYLGGHLATARKVGSREAAFEHDGVGPELRRP